MNVVNRTNGLALAAAAAALFLTAPMASAAAEKSAQGHCNGANACKGQSACGTPKNSCKGQNACKGQGFTVTTKEECEKVGGTFEMPKMEGKKKG